MCRLYKYFFYKLYSWGYLLHGDKEDHQYTAFFSLTILVLINILSIAFMLKIMLNITIQEIELTKVDMLLIGLLVSAPQYFILLHNQKYLKIIEEFNTEDRRRSVLGNIYIWIYIIISMFIFFWLMYIQIKINEGSPLSDIFTVLY